MNITVYLGALRGNDPVLKKTPLKNLVHGLEKTIIHSFMGDQNQD